MGKFLVSSSWFLVAGGLLLTAAPLACGFAHGAELTFRPQEFATDLEVGYAVNVVDMNDDKRPDVVVVDTKRVVWYENPSWKQHTLIQDQTKKDNVCLAPYDVDGDGKLDFALGADWRPFDSQTGGTIQWLARPTPPGEAHSTVRQIAEEPTTHRMRWADVDGDGRSELIVVPLMGRGTTKPLFAEAPVRVLAFSIPKDPARDRWPLRVLDEGMHVTHNFQPVDFDGDKDVDILCTSFEGVNLLTNDGRGTFSRTVIGSGNQATSPNRGASEIKLGRLAGGGRYIATIEPWHGHQVVVYTEPADPQTGLWTRRVVDEALKWGHAVWCTNLDGDADEELVIGVRDDLDEKDPTKRRGLRLYDPTDAAAGKWNRTLVDAGAVAIEDLAAADFDGDGDQDVVAVGRQTHNALIYWNETK
jgi:hypothetical protein